MRKNIKSTWPKSKDPTVIEAWFSIMMAASKGQGRDDVRNNVKYLIREARDLDGDAKVNALIHLVEIQSDLGRNIRR